MFETLTGEVLGASADQLTRAEALAALRSLPALRSAVDAFEVRLARHLDQLADHDGGWDARGALLADNGRSKTAARRSAHRAESLADMPTVAASFSEGNITTEQVDTLTRAAHAISPQAVEQSDLLATAEHNNVNLTNSATAKWTKDQRSDEEQERRHARNRQNRNATCRVRDEDDAWTLFLQGDQATGARIEAALDAETDRIWRADGGRDRTPEQVRNNNQRRYDAALNLLTGERVDDTDFTPVRNQVLWGVTDPGDAYISTANPNHPTAASTNPGYTEIPSSRDLDHSPTAHQLDRSTTPHSPRPGDSMATAGWMQPANASSDPNLVLNGPRVTDLRTGNVLPASVLNRLLCDADITSLLFDTNGDILWSGRTHRTAPPKLCRALIARDKGCVHCNAPPGHCEVHHLTEWKHRGTTDPDNCVLLCTRCHHNTHDRNIHLQNPTMNRLIARQREQETPQPAAHSPC